MASEFVFSLITSHKPRILSKSFSIGEDFALIKAAGGQLVEGAVRVCRSEPKSFARQLRSLKPNQALSFGVPAHDHAVIVPHDRLATTRHKSLPVIARTRENFSWPEGPGLMMLDYDPPSESKPLSREGLFEALFNAWAELRQAPLIWAASASSCIYRTDNGLELRGIAGQRVYIPIKQASDIPRAGTVLFKRLWLSGHGRFDVSKAGTLLDRSIIDATVWQPERLDFAGGALCGQGLDQRRPDPMAFNDGADFMDTVITLPELNRDAEERLKAIKSEARNAVEPLARKVRQSWVETRVTEALERIPSSKHSVMEQRLTDQFYKAVLGGALLSDFEIQTEKHGVLTVGQLLEDRKKYHNIRCRDPLEPGYGDDKRIAWINLQSAGTPYIWSHAHGGRKFTLHRAIRTIFLEKGALPQLVDQCLKLLLSDGSVFERGGELVRMGESGLYPVTQEWLAVHLGRISRFEKHDARLDQRVSCDAPSNLCKSILAMSGAWKLPRLGAILSAPTTVPETGRIIETDGYDEETQVYLDMASPDAWPGVSDSPTASQCRKAAETLWYPFSLFPFVDGTARGGWLACLLTAVCRPLLHTAPAFGLSATCAGTGKTLLALCAGVLAGPRCELLPPIDDEEEMRKRLVSVLRNGAQTTILDNITKPVDSSSLCAALTNGELSDRVLGASQTITVPTNIMIILTGNNLIPAGDLSRRMIRITLDAGMENPGRRLFEFDPLCFVRTHRLKLIHAALTLLRAFRAIGSPLPDGGRLASFEIWSDIIRGCVCWMGESGWLDVEDPANSVLDNHENDPETRKLGAVLSAWSECFGAEGSTVADAIRKAATDGNSALSDALDEIAGERGKVNPRRLGRWIEKHQGRIIEGMRFAKKGVSHHAVIWTVERVGELGSLGSLFNPNAEKSQLTNFIGEPPKTPQTP